MNPMILLIVLCLAQILIPSKKAWRYRNTDCVLATFVIFVGCLILDIFNGILTPMFSTEGGLYVLVVAQAAIIFLTKYNQAKKDKYVKYGIPFRYMSGWRYQLIGWFYEIEEKAPVLYTKKATFSIGIVSFLMAGILLSTHIYQFYYYNTFANIFIVPYFAIPLISMLLEFGNFCMGESKWEKLYKKYKNHRNCSNKRELARIRFSAISDFSYIFMKNFVWEPLHIIRATKFRWKREAFTSSIKYYDFENRSRSEYSEKEYNPQLEEFIQSNGIEVNELYVAAYNLIDRNQNVLLKTPSYVDFEPYFISMIKMKIAKTQKIVLIVSNEEKKTLAKKRIHEAFVEYMGFDEIPVMLTINECIEREEQQKHQKATEDKKNQTAIFNELTNSGWIEMDIEQKLPQKTPDIVLAAPEDICFVENKEFLRTVLDKLGLIVYYDFGDCVQEEALFAKIVHSVLDYDDKISTLYMSDGFFDLEQVVDNFFSKRNIYEIKIPRKPSRESYVMGWKAENINEMQSRTNPDASRDVGNHIPILYDAGPHTESDFIIVEDEFDTYVENQINFSNDSLGKRFEYHVGWTDVIGGNSVMCTVSDTYNNVAHTYLAMNGVGSQSEYINIISRPYLLRNYLMYHLRFFTLYPGVLSSYSPGLIKTPKAISYEAIVKLYVAGCTKEQLSRYTEAASLVCDNEPEKMIKALLECAGYQDDGQLEITSDIHNRYGIDRHTYQRIIDKSGLVEKIYFIANRQVIVRNKREYNYLIPHQKIVLNGVKYTVERILPDNRVELTDSNTREPLYIVRPVRSCRIDVREVEEYGTHIQNNSDSSLSFCRLISDVEVDVYGNIIYKDSYHPFAEEAKYDYHGIVDKQVKTYQTVNVFNVKIGSRLLNKDNCGRISHLFALLLNEMLPTFFPRHHKRIIVGCGGWTVDSGLETNNVTTRHTVAQMDINGIDVDEATLNIYILEDSPIETGLVNVFWQDEEFRYMLKVLEDYLYYQKIINRRERKEIFADSYEADLFLLKRILLEVINETFETYDAEGKVVSVFTNKIRKSRNKFNNLEIMDSFDVTCDFCGKKITAKSSQNIDYHFYHYSGLVSCMDCFSSAVCTEKHSQADIKHYEKHINNWFLKRYDDMVTTQYYNYLEDGERISELANVTTPIQDRFIVTDDSEAGGILGLTPINAVYGDDIHVWNNVEKVAITDEKVKKNAEIDDVVRASYLVEDIRRSYILIRDGLPYDEYMGVLAHEMTHQWQISTLDLIKITSNTPNDQVDEFSKGVDLTTYRLEGHAEWERIVYLKHHGHRRYARKEERILEATRNAYGLGYVWMRNLMKVGHDDMRIPADRTFSFIMKRNWYQLTNNSFALMKLYFGNGVSNDQQEEQAATEPVEEPNETELVQS